MASSIAQRRVLVCTASGHPLTLRARTRRTRWLEWRGRDGLDKPNRASVEPRGFEVEVALNPLHDVVVDDAVVAERQQRSALGVEELAHHPLVGE